MSTLPGHFLNERAGILIITALKYNQFYFAIDIESNSSYIINNRSEF